ncbi:MAG: hypothetical protein L6Q57_06080 [Alphaproteobacteria bacterium]|nr:hypothetical protein [Alphaproteobacteria bacterium]
MMRAEQNTRNLLQQAAQPFNIIEEFAALNPKRKILLCDHLFFEGPATFEKTVQLLWPESTASDSNKLEKFLVLLRKTAV